jgi:hypothetical protein
MFACRERRHSYRLVQIRWQANVDGIERRVVHEILKALVLSNRRKVVDANLPP